MQPSSETTSGSEESNTLKIKNFKEKAIEILNNENISKDDIVKVSKEIRENPLFEIEVKEKLFDEKFFEMPEQSNINPVFMLNLLNLIVIINFVWSAVKKNIESFHKILLELNIMFSFMKNEKKPQYEYALLSTVPIKFYEIIAEKGLNCFKKDYNFNKDFLSSDRNIAQVDLVYQVNTISQLNSLFNEKVIESPNIMYYIYHDKCEELFKKLIFNRPENNLDSQYTIDLSSHGYNEIDYSFILQDNIKISQNLIFNKVFDNNETIHFFNSNSQDNIELNKDTNIFVEIKTHIKSKEIIPNLIKNSDLFSEAYKNPAFGGIENKFGKDKKEYYLLYNNQRSDAISEIGKLNLEKDKLKDTKVIYNSGYVQISSIVSLQNQIRSMNMKIEKIIKDKENEKIKIIEEEEIKKKNMIEMFNQEKQEINKKMLELFNQEKQEINKKMLELFNQEKKKMKKEFKEDVYKKYIEPKILEFRDSFKVDSETIKSKLEEEDESKLAKNLMNFGIMQIKYSGLCDKVLLFDADNKILNSADKVIGKILKSEIEKKEFFELLSLLDIKISEKNFVSPYYEAFKSILTGPNWSPNYTPKNMGNLDIFSKSKFKDIIIIILRFIVVLEHDENLLNNFFEAVLYYVYNISKTDISCLTLFTIYKRNNDLSTIVSKFIKSINTQNHDSLFK